MAAMHDYLAKAHENLTGAESELQHGRTNSCARSAYYTRFHAAIAEVEARILAVYPDATFRLVEGEDPIGLYLDAYTNAEDAFAVLDLVSDWRVDLSVNPGVHLHVIPLPQEAACTLVYSNNTVEPL